MTIHINPIWMALAGAVLYALPIHAKANEMGRLLLLAALIAIAFHGGL